MAEAIARPSRADLGLVVTSIPGFGMAQRAAIGLSGSEAIPFPLRSNIGNCRRPPAPGSDSPKCDFHTP